MDEKPSNAVSSEDQPMMTVTRKKIKVIGLDGWHDCGYDAGNFQEVSKKRLKVKNITIYNVRAVKRNFYNISNKS